MVLPNYWRWKSFVVGADVDGTKLGCLATRVVVVVVPFADSWPLRVVWVEHDSSDNKKRFLLQLKKTRPIEVRTFCTTGLPVAIYQCKIGSINKKLSFQLSLYRKSSATSDFRENINEKKIRNAKNRTQGRWVWSAFSFRVRKLLRLLLIEV